MPRRSYDKAKQTQLAEALEKMNRRTLLTGAAATAGGIVIPTQPTAAQRMLGALDLLRVETAPNEEFPQDPNEFIRDFLGVKLWSKQQQIVDDVWNNRYTSVASAHSVGKSFVTAAIVITFLNLKRNSLVLSTAPTGRQVEHVLWRTIRRLYHDAPRKLLGNEPLTTRYDISDQWYGIGFKPNDTETDPLQGFHAVDVLAVIDEAAGVPGVLIDGMMAAMTTSGAHMLMIGNPTSTAGPFYDSHHAHADHWKKIVIAAEDTPNWTGEPYPVPGMEWPGLITKEWVQDVIDRYGEDSAYYQSRVTANWVSAEDVLITLAMIERAEQMHVIKGDNREAGIDVARGGRDKSVLSIRDASEVLGQWELESGESFQTADNALHIIQQHAKGQGIDIKVDEGGIGAGVVDALNFRIDENSLKHYVIPVNFGATAHDPEAYMNQRCEMYGLLANRFRTGDITFFGQTPPKYQLKAELSDIRRTFDGRHTQPLIEKKDDFRKRVGKSPDFADSLALAFYTPPRENDRKIGALGFGYADVSWGNR